MQPHVTGKNTLFETTPVLLAGDLRPVKLVAQIHDELLFEVNAQHCDLYTVAGEQNGSWLCPCCAMYVAAEAVNNLQHGVMKHISRLWLYV